MDKTDLITWAGIRSGVIFCNPYCREGDPVATEAKIRIRRLYSSGRDLRRLLSMYYTLTSRCRKFGCDVLIVFGGLPGVGKTTIARAVAIHHQATYLRIDTMEHAIRAAGLMSGDVGPAGYAIANAIAGENLSAGQMVIVDCVNPVMESRMGWRATAAGTGVDLLEIEVICSDPDEHRRRVESRVADIADFVLPSWEEVLRRDFQPWDRPHVVIDTALLTIEQAVAALERHIGR